jgi:hypothetical protein
MDLIEAIKDARNDIKKLLTKLDELEKVDIVELFKLLKDLNRKLEGVDLKNLISVLEETNMTLNRLNLDLLNNLALALGSVDFREIQQNITKINKLLEAFEGSDGGK